MTEEEAKKKRCCGPSGWVGMTERRRKLKVFYGAMLDGGVQFACIMATTSQKKFSKATGATRGYFSETGNEQDIKTAMTKPETIFVNKNRMGYPRIWVPLKKKRGT